MKKIIITLLLLIISTHLLASFSLGFSIGLPGKITTKYQFNERFGVDFSIAPFVGKDMLGFSTHSDLLFFTRELLIKDDLAISAYGGVGTSLSTVPILLIMAGIRMPFGIQMPIEFDTGHKVEVFLEIAPEYVVFVLPGATFSASLGARYVF